MRFLCTSKETVGMRQPLRLIGRGAGGHIIVPSYRTDHNQSKDDPQTHRHVL